MHVLELSSALQAQLYNLNTAPIITKVVMRGQVSTPSGINADGTLNFSGQAVHEFEVTDRLSDDNPIRISSDRPETPSSDGTGTRSSNVTIALVNTDGYLATTQNGAKVNSSTIQHVEFDIYASVGGEDLLLYRGRTIGYPLEEFGITTFTCRDTLWEAINTPVRMPMIDSDQDLYADENGNLVISFHQVGTTYYTDAYAYYDGSAQIKPAFEVGDKAKIDLSQIDFPAGADYPLGKWEIEFIDSQRFEFRSPLSAAATGFINSDFISPDGIGIKSGYWNYDSADLKGEKITFWTYFTARGNPITIIKQVLEWGLGNTWGDALTEPSTLPINWTELTEIEAYYSGVTVYVSETNKDNKVFADGKPLSVKRLVEMIAGHILAFPTFDTEGKFTLISNQLMPSRFAYEINSDMITSHRLGGGQNIYNKLTASYGYDDLSEEYFGQEVYSNTDIEPYNTIASYSAGNIATYQGVNYYCTSATSGNFDPTKWAIYQGKELQVNFKYYKLGASFAQIKVIGGIVWNRAQLSGITLEATIISQFGLPLKAGDKVLFNLTTQPEMYGYFELTSTAVTPGQNVPVKGVLIPFGDYQKPGNWCEGFYCEGFYCY